MQMEPTELQAWLHLAHTPGLGRAACRRLMASLGSPEQVLAAGPWAWSQLLKPAALAALQQGPAQLPDLLDRTLQWLAAHPDHQLLCLGDPDYPVPLLNTADPPLLLYLAGRRALLGRDAVAVVGTRHPTAHGQDHARHFAERLSAAGWCVTSGLAQGIDGVAHQGALMGAGGSIGVLGTGLDRIYPAAHKALATQMRTHGLLISEYPLGSPPLQAHFPQRNRIIAGLSMACLVVEAALKSGSLITARLAAEAGREVYALPGPIHASESRGCHALLKEGARLIETPEELLEELKSLRLAGSAAPSPSPRSSPTSRSSPASPTPAPSQRPLVDDAPTDDPVLLAMGHEPVSLDALLCRGLWSPAELSARLLDLELDGAVTRLPGALFQRRAQA